MSRLLEGLLQWPGDTKADHIDAETLEGYALGHLAEPQLGRVEEHLLICESAAIE